MMFAVYFEVTNKYVRVKVLLAIDTYTLALHRKTLLVIRSHIIPRRYAFSLRVSCGRESKGDTLCLPQRNHCLLLFCKAGQKPAFPLNQPFRMNKPHPMSLHFVPCLLVSSCAVSKSKMSKRYTSSHCRTRRTETNRSIPCSNSFNPLSQ